MVTPAVCATETAALDLATLLTEAKDLTHEVRPGGVKGNRVYPARGVYFATHFGNWYERATEAEIAAYVRELKHWGCNSLTAWFDMHDFTGMDDPAAAPRLKLVRSIFRSAKANGLKTGMVARPRFMDAILGRYTLSPFSRPFSRRSFPTTIRNTRPTICSRSGPSRVESPDMSSCSSTRRLTPGMR